MVGIGVIGAGNWGKNLVRDFSQLPDSDLRWICDASSEALGRLKRAFPAARTTKSFDEVLGDPKVQAVAVAVPVVKHFEVAKAALEAGKHVFVEKPITLHSSEAEELIEIAEDKNLRLMVGHLLRYHPAVEKLQALIRSGELGEVYYIYAQRVNLGQVRKDENAMWSFAPHDISVILHLLDSDPVQVSAMGQAYLQDSIEDVSFLTMRFPSGQMANIQLSWLDPHKVRKFTIVGSQKMVTFDDMEPTEKIRIYDKGISRNYDSYGEWISLRFGDIHIPRVDMGEPLKRECQHFLDCVRSGDRPKTDGREGLRVLRVLEAAQSSLDQGGVPVDLKSKGVLQS